MVPAGRCCRPKGFPRYRLAFESRPFRDEPPPFLCAIGPPGYQPDGPDAQAPPRPSFYSEAASAGSESFAALFAGAFFAAPRFTSPISRSVYIWR
jgi:hypothetical protein